MVWTIYQQVRHVPLSTALQQPSRGAGKECGGQAVDKINGVCVQGSQSMAKGQGKGKARQASPIGLFLRLLILLQVRLTGSKHKMEGGLHLRN